MKPKSGWIKLLICCVLASLLLASPAFGQVRQQPVMQNVFYNVVWGSAFGATLGLAMAIIASQDKAQPTDARGAAFNGATLGGLAGLGMGLYLIYTGISFDASASQFSASVGASPGVDPVRNPAVTPPFVLETSTRGSFRITGFRATVLDLKF